MFKFYRGTTSHEANALSDGTQHRDVTHWTDSLEKAQMYSKGAVIEIELDELPPHFNAYRSIAHGDAVHGNIRQWVISREFYENRLFNWVEETRIH